MYIFKFQAYKLFKITVNIVGALQVHHTATHLLQAALKEVIGQETSQAGSLVAFDRLRFDFNFHRPLLDNELAKIEMLINGWIEDAILLQTKVMPLSDAKKAGAIAMFGEKYGEEVGFTTNTFDFNFEIHLAYFCYGSFTCVGYFDSLWSDKVVWWFRGGE